MTVALVRNVYSMSSKKLKQHNRKRLLTVTLTIMVMLTLAQILTLA